jgi:hypothetical protein
VAAIAATGGYLQVLPKDLELPSWTQQLITEETDYTLLDVVNLRQRRIQIDCYADDPDDCIALANAIDAVVNGYHGTLTDADSTVVQGIFQSTAFGFYDGASRSYRRTLEYDVWFDQGA